MVYFVLIRVWGNAEHLQDARDTLVMPTPKKPTAQNKALRRRLFPFGRCQWPLSLTAAMRVVLYFGMGSKGPRYLEPIAYTAQLLQHAAAVFGVGVAVDLHVEVVLPGVLFHGTTAEGRHVVAVFSDDADGICKGACFVPYGEHQNRIGMRK